MIKVGIIKSNHLCPKCAVRLKTGSREVNWSTHAGKLRKRKTSGYICFSCGWFYVMQDNARVYSSQQTLFLVTTHVEPEKMQKHHANNQLSVKDQKKIYTARFPESKSCANCNFYMKDKRCTVHNLRVENNELCNRYQNFTPRIYYGGGFSPR